MNDIIKLIDMIEKRPALYLSRHTISALKAFLDGWQMREPKDIVNMEVFANFQSYIEDYYEINGHSWDKIILLFSQDESDALSDFFVRYKEMKIIYRQKNV
ncbi:hypothetical protein KXR87_23140 [Yokenella regensburgei]|uniref:hypothetical protein n=1 Tax=Yokenella regensburgei TaxID=158877 RepID=UPI003F18C8F9